MRVDENEEKDKGIVSENPMADAFDFDVPDGNPDEIPDEGDDEESASQDGDGENDSTDADDGEQNATPESVDPRLLVRIGRMNLSDTETDRILGLKSNDAITDMLELLESRLASGKSSESEEAEWFELSEETAEKFDEDLSETLKSMNSSTRKAVEQMFQKYEDRIQAMDRVLSERNNDAFDDAIDSLGKDWQSVFGKEDSARMDQKSEQWRNREALRREVFSGKYKGSVPRRVNEAAKIVFADHQTKIAKDAKIKKARDRQGRFIEKPARGSLSEAGMSPRQKAVSNASKFMKERGIHPEQTDAFDVSAIA